MSGVPHFTLDRDAFGRLVLTDAQGMRHDGVTPVRAFPIAAPDEGLSVVDAHGREQVWIERLSELPAQTRALLQDELAQREFNPVIERLDAVSSVATPSTWTVTTDRGVTAFVLKSEDDIRRLPSGALLIASSHGVVFSIRDRAALDSHSRRLLQRFL